jgi:hypothetical protein
MFQGRAGSAKTDYDSSCSRLRCLAFVKSRGRSTVASGFTLHCSLLGSLRSGSRRRGRCIPVGLSISAGTCPERGRAGVGLWRHLIVLANDCARQRHTTSATAKKKPLAARFVTPPGVGKRSTTLLPTRTKRRSLSFQDLLGHAIADRLRVGGFQPPLMVIFSQAMWCRRPVRRLLQPPASPTPLRETRVRGPRRLCSTDQDPPNRSTT